MPVERRASDLSDDERLRSYRREVQRHPPKRRPIVRGVTPSAEAHDLYDRLMQLARIDEARAEFERGPVAERPKRARAGVPNGAAGIRHHTRELVAALPVLRAILSRAAVAGVTSFGGVAERRPDGSEPDAAARMKRYAVGWRSFADEWNEAIELNGWRTLAPICRACGLAVLVRGADAFGRLSFACSNRCAATLREGKSRAKRKVGER